MATGISNSQGIKKALRSLDSPLLAVQRKTPPKNKKEEKMMINVWVKFTTESVIRAEHSFPIFFVVF